MANPLIPQGLLNRLIATIVFPLYPQLTVTPPFLSKRGIRFSRENATVTQIEMMTGVVNSPEPYQMVTMRAGISKTNGLAALYEAQILASAVVGPATVIPDTTQSALPPYTFDNCSIRTVDELLFDGSSAEYPVEIRGVYYINNLLWGDALASLI